MRCPRAQTIIPPGICHQSAAATLNRIFVRHGGNFVDKNVVVQVLYYLWSIDTILCRQKCRFSSIYRHDLMATHSARAFARQCHSDYVIKNRTCTHPPRALSIQQHTKSPHRQCEKEKYVRQTANARDHHSTQKNPLTSCVSADARATQTVEQSRTPRERMRECK